MKAPQPKKLSRQEFKNHVLKLLETGQVKVTAHLRRDHPERAISFRQIEMCLEKGTVQTDPFLNAYGNWQGEIYRHMAGQELIVVAALEWEEQVIVITAFEP
ncbi:hypothetical protein ATC00_02030 [Sinorhizobium americanum]|nr:hypothetical protein ATC00_02030 [Sinorhizobium americanum]